jgi:putative flippase GtrA
MHHADAASIRRFVAFNGVGAAGIVVQLGVIAVLVERAGVDYQLATGAGVLAALVHNFAWHRVWTWSDRRGEGAGVLPLFGRFVLANGMVSLVGNVLFMRLLVGAGAVPVLPASGIAIVLCGLVNYWLADRHVFAADFARRAPASRRELRP